MHTVQSESGFDVSFINTLIPIHASIQFLCKPEKHPVDTFYLIFIEMQLRRTVNNVFIYCSNHADPQDSGKG